MKVDSNVFVNANVVVRHLRAAASSDFAEGVVRLSETPSRDRLSERYTPFDKYPERTFPDYIDGTAYFLSGDIARRVYTVSHYVRYLNWDDVFLGMVLKKLGVKLSGAHGRRFNVLAPREAWDLCKMNTALTIKIFMQSGGPQYYEAITTLAKRMREINDMDSVVCVRGTYVISWAREKERS
ncbi:beta-1,3-galactosyltransferase 5-like [Saccoglossus kowalevskii]